MRVDDPIEQLIAGAYADPESGELLRAESRAVAIADSLDGAELELIEALGVARGEAIAVVSDLDTRAVLGARVERALASAYRVAPVVMGRAPVADDATVARLAAAIDPRATLIVAVGSGTINDLCKVVAMRFGVPQAVFATAPSMNGYTSVSASITDATGLKRSLRAKTPAGVFFDLGVVARAPVRLIRAGLGDSCCRPTAQADWLLSHLLWGTPYREAPFALLAGDEAALLAEPAALVGGDLAAVRRLARTLVLSGFGMTIAGGSYPASQGEHLISHYVEMTQPPGIPHTLHGEHIAVATLACAALQERVLAGVPRVRPSTLTRADVIAHFGEALGEACWREVQPKLLDAARAESLNARIEAEWPAMRARLAAVSHGADAIRRVLLAAGAPTVPSELGWSDALFASALSHAREIRNRYTFLDLVADSDIVAG